MSSQTNTRSQKNPASPSDALLQQFVGYNMKRAYMRIQDHMTETLAPMGLRIGTFSALAVLIDSPGISQTQLSQVLNIKRSGVVVVVDELERAGVIERKPVPGDRRAYSLMVTAAGKHLWHKAEDLVKRHEKQLMAGFTDADLHSLNALLGQAARSNS